MILLLACMAATAFVFYLLGMREEHDRPGGTLDQRQRAVLAEEQAADFARQLVVERTRLAAAVNHPSQRAPRRQQQPLRVVGRL